jgi:hypothetical protein
VAKTLSATLLSEETKVDTNELSRSVTLVSVVRIGSPLLLKTNLPRPPDRAQVASERICFSIAGYHLPGNDSGP